MPDRFVRIVSLWVHPGQEPAFEAYERAAAQIMARHGGRIDLAMRPENVPDAPFEVHFVSFPDREAASRYAQDPGTLLLRKGRESIISRTDIVEGLEAGPY